MKILLLCDRYPNSYRDGLLLRVLHLAKRLCHKHEIDLLCYHEGLLEGEATTIFRKIWTVPRPSRRSPRGWAGAWAGWDPRLLYPVSERAIQLFGDEIAPENYDVVWDAGASMFPMLPARWEHVPVVADLVDDMVLTFWRAMRSTPGWLAKLKILKYLGVNLLFERHCMRRVAHCCVVSDDDARYFSAVSPHVPVTVVPNGVDIDYFTPGKTPTIPGRVVFEGTMAFEPNQQAASYLVREVMPHIWRHRPDASVALVGRDPPAFIRDLANDRVLVTGAVDDIRPYVQQAEVFVCPLLSGAGIKNKLLQAWAMGKAVVATSVSVGGLMATDGDNLLVRDGELAVAEAVLALMNSPERCRTLGNAGMATVTRSFTWQAQAELFESILLNVASSSRR